MLKGGEVKTEGPDGPVLFTNQMQVEIEKTILLRRKGLLTDFKKIIHFTGVCMQEKNVFDYERKRRKKGNDLKKKDVNRYKTKPIRIKTKNVPFIQNSINFKLYSPPSATCVTQHKMRCREQFYGRPIAFMPSSPALPKQKIILEKRSFCKLHS